ncbi:13949_t:CDS:2 [Acaulospora morrowiae]|uniref:13949_t:CDS:1 n=1 Tax=Acaulospora morrowiae TaxID=94023 RepID=A0A9N8WIR0_9GLOM|nr:13949_t:CDS:2 [Acaulospora morrowiae]
MSNSKNIYEYLDLDNLDMNRAYSLEEFEIISDQLKYRTLIIDDEPIHHFELDKSGKLIPMPPTVFRKEYAVAKIVAQLENWNKESRQKGVVTSSQGFKLESGEVVAPDVAYTPRDTCHGLDDSQLDSFQGEPFSPTVVVEVEDFENIHGTKFNKVDLKFKNVYFAPKTSVQLGWLIDPKYEHIWIYRRDARRVKKRTWSDLDGEEYLPGFTLEVAELEWQDPGSLEASDEEEELEYSYSECDQSFDSKHLLMKHLRRDH